MLKFRMADSKTMFDSEINIVYKYFVIDQIVQ